jgi:hypothetical protein
MIVDVPKERALEIMEKTATFFAVRRMGAPAILLFESIRPLHFIGSQIMYFVSPFANVLFQGKEFEEFAAIMQEEENVRYLIQRIDELDEQFNGEQREKEKLKRKKFWNKIKSFFKKG